MAQMLIKTNKGCDNMIIKPTRGRSTKKEAPVKETPKVVEQPKYKIIEEKPIEVEISEEEIKIEENLFDED